MLRVHFRAALLGARILHDAAALSIEQRQENAP